MFKLFLNFCQFEPWRSYKVVVIKAACNGASRKSGQFYVSKPELEYKFFLNRFRLKFSAG